MKRWLIALIAIAMVAGFSTVASAVVQGTHHDMATYVGGTRDTCYPCHGFKETGTADAGLKNVGSMCYNRCHIGAAGTAGAGMVALSGAYPERGTFRTTDNTLRISSYSSTPRDKYATGHLMGTAAAALPAPDAATDVTGLGWPYGSDTAGMQCTTCHDVHENLNTPFIRAPLSDNTTRTNSFCIRCHRPVANGAARWADLSLAQIPNGSHPSEADWQAAGSRSTNNRLGRNITFKDLNDGGAAPTANNVDNSVFRNQSYSGTNLNSNANHYNPGGKLGDFALSGNVGCYTCHAAHLPTGAGLPQLIVAQYLGAAARTQSDMCVGCHGTTARSANPGTTSFYHPVDTETLPQNVTVPASAVYLMSTGADNIVVNMSGIYDNGTGLVLTCMTCHAGRNRTATADYGVHNGTGNMSIIAASKPNCAACHATATVQSGTTPNSHHVYGGTTNYNTTLGYPAAVTFSTGNVANLTTGLSCDSCHIGNGTAHNWN